MPALREESFARSIRIVGVPAEEAVADSAVSAEHPAAEPLAAGPRPVDGARVPIERRRQSIGTGPVLLAPAPSRPPVPVVFVSALIFALVLWSNLSRPSLNISDVTSAGRLVADGTAHDVTVAFKAPRAAVRGVEVRAVDGSGDAAPRVFEVSPAAATGGRIAAGAIAVQSEQPRAVTYRFVLLGDEGVRSSPFTKTFEFAAAPPQPPIIAGLAGLAGIPVPPDPAAANPPAPAAGNPPAQAAGNPPAQAAGNPPTPAVGNPPAPSGVRSPPRRAVAAVRKPAASTGCTRETCGLIVATRAVEPSPQDGVVGFFRRIFASDAQHESQLWEVVVRRDDGTVRVVNDATRWNTGSRVRIVGDHLLAPPPRGARALQQKRRARWRKLT